ERARSQKPPTTIGREIALPEAMTLLSRQQTEDRSPMPTLFDILRIGDLEVPNRVFLAPLTRNRSTGPGRVPNAMMRDYYVQRASAGLILSEETSVAPAGVGY